MKEIKLEYLLFIFLVLTSCGALVKGVASGQLTEKKRRNSTRFWKR